MDILALISLISGVYFIIFSLINNTNNFASSLIFKVIPFFCGLGSMFVGLRLMNVI